MLTAFEDASGVKVEVQSDDSDIEVLDSTDVCDAFLLVSMGLLTEVSNFRSM